MSNDNYSHHLVIFLANNTIYKQIENNYYLDMRLDGL
jgi:hypothetical protein